MRIKTHLENTHWPGSLKKKKKKRKPPLNVSIQSVSLVFEINCAEWRKKRLRNPSFHHPNQTKTPNLSLGLSHHKNREMTYDKGTQAPQTIV